MKWLLIFVIYLAPDNAVDWDGPWELGDTHLVEGAYDSEAECRSEAIQAIGRMHQDILVPIRYRCVAVEDWLPEGAPR